MKTNFIIQLSAEKQNKIKKDLIIFFKEELNLTDLEIQEEVELAMSSRLIDLQDSININQYIDNN